MQRAAKTEKDHPTLQVILENVREPPLHLRGFGLCDGLSAFIVADAAAAFFNFVRLLTHKSLYINNTFRLFSAQL